MNIQEYIASGILEQYALGTLSSGEEREVLANAAQYPEIRAELDKIEAALERYAMSDAITPPTELITDILKKIDDTKPSVPHLRDDDTSDKSGNRFGKFLSWLPYILLPLLLLTAIWGYFGHRGNKESQEARLKLGEDLTDCRTERKQLRDTINFYRAAIKFVNDENTRAIAMEGNEKLPGASTTIHTNSASQITYFAINDLPVPPEGRQYQLWAIKGGTPQSLGVFDISPDPIMVDYVPGLDAYAVSLEQRGGVAVPTDVRIVGAVKS